MRIYPPILRRVEQRWQKWIDGETGKRSDVPHHFIYNQEDNKNLQVLDGRRVKRILFEYVALFN
jgi:hypothetical protein